MEQITQFFNNLLNLVLWTIFFIGFLLVGFLIAKTFLSSYFAKKNLQEKILKRKDYTLLAIKVPKNNTQQEAAADSLFASLHSSLKTKISWPFLTQKGRDLSFEIAVKEGNIYFHVFLPKSLVQTVSGQFFAQYPEVEIAESSDYLELKEGFSFAGAELKLKNHPFNSLKTYPSFEINPLVNFSGALSGLNEGQEEVSLQILTVPVNFSWIGRLLLLLKYRFSYRKQLVESKTGKPLFQTKMRVLAKADDLEKAKTRVKNVLSTFKQFDNSGVQSFKAGKVQTERTFFDLYKNRVFDDFGFLLNSEELATIFHLPYTQAGVSGVVKTTAKKLEPPSDLSRESNTQRNELSLFAETNFRGEKIKFGIKREDRRRHLYVVGKSGTGKSKLLELSMLEDIKAGKGFGLIDPHGDLSEMMIRHVPKERVAEVVYFNPADDDYPMAFNLLESAYKSEEKQQIVQGFIGIFKKLFSVDFNPRLEHMIRYIVLALLESPGSTILGINRLLTDIKYRQRVIAQISDPVVKSFWANEFSSFNERYSNEAIVPILNKMGQFIANPIVRNTVGQTRNSVDFRKIMDEGKILIMNLSRGRLGEENSDLLGSMVITKIQQAAISRANLPEEQRTDFCLYVDEFQNFATAAFANIFTEARKYHLNLTVAHQYLTQLPPEVKGTVFGNVGSLVSFRVGAEDAAFLSAEFAPNVSADDLISLDARDMYLKISIDGRTSNSFSAKTMDCPKPLEFNQATEIVSQTRMKYARPRITVENEIAKWQSSESLEETGEQNFPEPIV